MKKKHLFNKQLWIAVWVFGILLLAGPLVLVYALPVQGLAPAAWESMGVPEGIKISLPVTVQDEPTHLLAAGEKVGVPVRIKIPSIALDAAIEKVALTAKRSMDVPKDPFNTGWYQKGPRPGEKGSATIDGHVNWINGATAVFADLHNVKPGDKIAVQDDKGAIISFVVRETRLYDATARATEVFKSHDGKPHLNLITCDGVWDKTAKRYSKRLVVFADKE